MPDLEFASTRLGRQYLADVSRIARALEKLAESLDKLSGEAKEERPPERKGGDDA